MAAEPKILLFDEVAKHNLTKDCWLIISGKGSLKLKANGGYPPAAKVYDVTSFMEDHPGGDEVLLAATGKDATNDFEDVGHSDTAREMMDKYYIGEIDASTIPLKRAYIPAQTPSHVSSKPNESLVRILQFLVPLMILGLAFAVRYLTKTE